MVMLPNGFTLANLFFGILAIISASRGEYERAVWYIVIGGICDAIDGRIARATGTGSRFGEELDSLVDAISFGLAPALIMYFAVLTKETLDWIFVFLFAACAVMRLARFNVEQAGRSKRYFRGLPSPAAGGVLATYLWFSQTPLYSATRIGDLPWHGMVRFMMAGLGFLMISNVPYPAWPAISGRSFRGVIGLIIFAGLAVGLFVLPREFFFPVGMAYVISGLLVAVVKGLLDKPGPFDDADEESASLSAYGTETDEHDVDREARPRRRRRRGGRGVPASHDSPGHEGPAE